MYPHRRRTNLAAIAFLLSLFIHVVSIVAMWGYVRFHDIARQSTVALLPIDILPPPDSFGESESTGTSNSSSQAEGVQRAPKPSQDQAALTRDPEGNESGAQPPAVQPTPPAEALAAMTEPQAFRPPAQQLTLESAPIGRSAKAAPTPVDAKDDRSQTEQLARAQPPAPSPSKPEVEPRPVPPRSHAGTPLEHSDRDSDLFASEFSVQYERGQVKARQGREFKFARPRENLAAITDTAVISFPAVCRLKVETDEHGNVRRVTIDHSTGSSALDRIFELATYSSWFEPPKDDDGKPKRDQFTFAITLE